MDIGYPLEHNPNIVAQALRKYLNEHSKIDYTVLLPKSASKQVVILLDNDRERWTKAKEKEIKDAFAAIIFTLETVKENI